MTKYNLFGLFVAITIPMAVVSAFLVPNPPIRIRVSYSSTRMPLSMVRNIDLPEALVFYGKHVYQQDDGALLPGVELLLQECQDIQTPVIVLSLDDSDNDSMMQQQHHDHVLFRTSRHAPPNPRDLYTLIQETTIQPRGFGGSSGFGRKLADPERPILPQHVVVLCDSIEACRAARLVGARVLCLDTNDNTNNPLADAIVDSWQDITCLEDVATPGSYWLNPPHPKDDDGNRIDIDQVMEWYETTNHQASSQNVLSSSTVPEVVVGPPPAMTEDELSRILADLDPL